MNWISIDNEKCDGCKFCIVRCPRCFSKVGEEIVGQADETNCNVCGHCISLCEPEAITHELMEMDNFPSVNPDDNFDPATFFNFVRNRRSHRHFKNKAIEKTELEMLVDACRYAPTGGNVQNVELVVVEDRDKIKKLSNLTVDTYVGLGEAAAKEAEQLLADGKEVPEALLRTQTYGQRMDESRSEGLDPIFFNASAVMIFHSTSEPGSAKDNCVIASTTVSLLARTMGIESTFIGFFVTAANGNPEIRKELQLPENNSVLSVLMMGYPRLKFHYAVDRFPLKVNWF